jgi:hypothetical protein
MSGEVALWAARQDIPNHAAKMVLIALGDAFDDRTGRCFPSHQAIGDFVRRSESAIKKAVRWLEENGWIKREARFTETGRQTSSTYEILFERGESFLAMVARRRKMHGDKQARWDENRKPLEGERGYIPPEDDEGAKKGPETSSKTAPSEGAEKSPPGTESLLNKGAQARDDENMDVVEGVDWRNRLVQYRKRAIWPPKWGPVMGKRGCLIPAHLVREWVETNGEAFREEKQAKRPQNEPKSWTKAIRGSKSKTDGRNLPGTSHD